MNDPSRFALYITNFVQVFIIMCALNKAKGMKVNMEVDKISFITQNEGIFGSGMVLEKEYSSRFNLLNGDEISLCSNVGNRKNQEDCIAVSLNDGYLLLLVSDGMGGMNYGELASYATARTIKDWFDFENRESLKYLDKQNLEDVLNGLIYLISTHIPHYSGSTLNMSIIGPNVTFVINVGDSRTYMVKDGKISLVTNDDSLIFRKYNPKTRDERNKLRFHKKNNIIVNSISKNAFPNIKIISINNNDYDILCHVTDGITDYLSESLILRYLRGDNSALMLVNNAIRGLPIYGDFEEEEYNERVNPGNDNATAVVYTKKRVRIAK